MLEDIPSSEVAEDPADPLAVRAMYEKSPPGTSRTLITVAQQDRSNKTSSTDALQKRPDLNPHLECSEHPRGGKHGREVSRVAQNCFLMQTVARPGNVR